ncbi:MAG: aldo/keto reductase [Candidatus Shapirobacteria bacterium]|jgi:diketogulonate reductase-like aldo/keto reductase
MIKTIPTKKLTNGFEMPVLGLGTWMMGEYPDLKVTEIKSVEMAINSGISHIDTAESYAQGGAEEIVGQAIKNFDRKKIFLVSKVAKNNLSFEDVIAAAKGSLKRLGVDYLDLYLVHKPNLEIPIAETMKAMNWLKKEGWIKNIGVSNFNIKRLEEAQSLCDSKIVANQLHLNLVVRETEKAGLVDYCQKNDMLFVAWRPLQTEGILGNPPKVMEEMMSKYQKTAAQIALNWLISQNNVVAITKMGSQEHLDENLKAVGWQMETADIERLRKEFPNQRMVSDVVPLI